MKRRLPTPPSKRSPARPQAGQPDRNTAQNPGPTLNKSAARVLAEAASVLDAEGPTAAIALLDRAVRGGGFDRRALLTRFAQQIQRRHPQAAMEVARAILDESPDAMGVLGLLGSLQDRVGDRAGARQSVLRVVTSEHSAPREVLNAANLLVRLGDHQLAAKAAVEAFEKLGRPLRDASRLLYIAQRVADLDTIDALVAQMRQAYAEGKIAEAAETPRTHLLWCDDEALNIEVVKAWSAGNMALPEGLTPPPVEPLEGRRIRVGYLSSDFREHPTSLLINGLLRNHDRSRFEVFLYCSGWDDGSAMRREIESHAEHVHTVTPLSDEAAAALIRSHRIDVLVELNGPTRANRMGILAHRPAPVQIDYLGWPGSVGGRVVDYVVGDWQTVPPGAEKAYPEQVIRLNKVYQINDYAATPKPPTPSRDKVRLPADRPVVGMFNAINKVGSEVWRTWMRVLHAVPEAVFWVLDPGPAARENLSRAAASQGVDPKRIVWAPKLRHQVHWARLGCCDLILDPWPYGGHTSTADALFAGVPVIAMDCGNFAGRVSGALLRAAGLGVLVQSDVDSYVRTAVGLLRNPSALEKARRFIAEKVPTSDVFNALSKTRQMEAAYRVALQRVVQGLAPMHIAAGDPPSQGARRSVAPVSAPARVERAPRPLVVAAAIGYEPDALVPFFHSLRRYFGGEVLVFSNDESPGFGEICRKYRVQVSRAMQQRHGPAIDRFYAVRDLLGADSAYSEVFFTDIRDVFFQASPFSMPTGRRIEFFLEPKQIADCQVNTKWLTSAFGAEAARAIGAYRVSCCGTVLGTGEGMLEYTSRLVAELERLLARGVSATWGIDQAIHNQLIHTGAFPDCALGQSGESLVQTLYHERVFRFDRAGRLLNADGSVCPVVHQYDRTEKLFGGAYRASIFDDK